MQTDYRSFFGPDAAAMLFGAADREGLSKLPPGLLQPTTIGEVIGSLSPASRKIALNLAAFAAACQKKHDEAKAAGDEAHTAFDIAYQSMGIHVHKAASELLVAQLACDADMPIAEIYEKYEGETILGLPEVRRRQPMFDIVIVGSRPFGR